MHEATVVSLLAQDPAPGAGGWLQMLPFAAVALLAYFMFVLPQRAKDKQYRDLVSGLKENDHVVTTGGIHGVVTNVQREAEKVTIRIDESTGAKMKIAIWAVSHVVGDEKATDKSKADSGKK